MSVINITIDGRKLCGEVGETILAVAKRHQITIPTLCHSDRVSHNTSCFVCVVKEKKSGRFIPSCAYSIYDGLQIECDTPEVSTMRQSALNLLLSEHTGDCEAPCTIYCPAHAKVEEYIREGKLGNHLRALEIIKERIPLPMSIGRVCPRFCEKACRRNVLDRDSPVAINDFKRLAADLHYDSYMESLPPLNGKEVGIVGAGPGGLSIAYFLRREGTSSVIYEVMPKAGGMLRYGIPEYRLPKAILDREIEHFYKMGGIRINFNKKLGQDFSIEELKGRYDAVAIAIGSWTPATMSCEGDNLATGGITWLEKIALQGWQGDNPGRTIVIGGGNTAMDCLRTAVRCGSREVICCYRRSEQEMPAERIEIHEAKEEGVEFQFLTAPLRLREQHGKKILTCQKMTLGEADASGRRRPVPVPGSEFEIVADTVISAIGQKTRLADELHANRWGNIDVDPDDYSVGGKVFAVGDCVSGPASIVDAVGAARVASAGIIAYINGKKHKEPYEINVTRGQWQSLSTKDLVFLNEPVIHGRTEQGLIGIEARMHSFQEVARTFTAAEISKEGERCLECSCTAKTDCKLKECSESYGARPDALQGLKIAHRHDIRHPTIILDRNKCIKCGVCVKVCKDVVNRSLLGIKARGYETKIGTAFDSVLPDSCNECGECLKECPVGALDWRLKHK